MALIRELEDHGCSLRGSVICKYIKGDVTRCVACEYKKATDEQRMQVVIDYYINEKLLDKYPIANAQNEETCALCHGAQKNPATTKAYAKITNKALDVMRDLAGTGGRINGGEIDVEVPACQPCMKNIRKIKRFHYAILASIVVLIGAAVYAFNGAIAAGSSLVMMLIFFVSCAVGAGMYIGAMRAYQAAIGKKTFINVLDLPALRGFKQKGWYVRRSGMVMPTLHETLPLAVVDELRPETAQQAKMRKNQKKRKSAGQMREE